MAFSPEDVSIEKYTPKQPAARPGKPGLVRFAIFATPLAG
jgi:hypothetical protein